MATQEKNVKFITGTESINSFLKMARKCKQYTAEEERDLFNDYFKNGNLESRDKIVQSLMLYVYSFAKKYCRNEEEILDYVNEGIIGLYKAIDKFDIDKGTRFITHAQWYISREMREYMFTTRDTVIKSNNSKYTPKIKEIRDEFMKREQRMPTNDEIRDEMLNKYNEVVKDNRDLFDLNIESINVNIDEDNNTLEELGDFAMRTASYNEYDTYIETNECSEEEKTEVNKLLDILPVKNKEMLCMYYGIGYNNSFDVEDIADKFNMHVEDVERIVDKTIAYLAQESKNIIGKTA